MTMLDMKLSPNFALHELVRSQVATRLGIDNTPDSQQIENLARLCTTLLEPVRAILGGRVISIDSGFRCPALNKAVGGAGHSAHMDGLAADILVAGLSPLQVCRLIQGEKPGTFAALDKCIFEGTWTHLGIAAPLQEPVGEFLTAHFSAGGVEYSSGIA